MVYMYKFIDICWKIMLMYKYNEKKLYIGDTYSGTGRPPWGRPPHPLCMLPQQYWRKRRGGCSSPTMVNRNMPPHR
jgi:hypothetical protein